MKKETLEEVAERLYPNYQQEIFINGAKWQKKQDNKELAMWKLAVEKQEARCTALRSVISDLQKNSYSEEEVVSFIYKFIKEHQPQLPYLIGGINMWFNKFKKK